VHTSDTDGHGTHVASIAGGTANAAPKGSYRGIAHGADLVGFQAGVPDAKGEIRFESVTVLEAFNYAIKKREALDIRVVSNAWGVEGTFEPDSPINQATFQLYRVGLVVVFAAGNDGTDGPGSLNKYCVAPWVLCVAAGDYMNKPASFSSRGTDPAVSGKAYDHPDIMAPGVQITAARPLVDPDGSGGRQASGGPQVNYATKSGTSMATPHVAGAAALLLGDNPRLSPDEVYDLLVATATPLVGQPVWAAGAGYLNALDATRAAKDTPGTLAWFLDGHMKYGGRATGDRDFVRDPVSVGLGQGTARQATGSDIPPDEFVEDLATTPMGIVFVAGSVVLAGTAFGNRRLLGF
jgi:subtilisin family serine protease